MYASESSMQRDSIFEVMVPLGEGASVNAIIGCVERAIDGLAANLDPQAYERAERTLQDRHLLRLETSLGRARELAIHGSQFRLGRLAPVSSTDVQQAVPVYLGHHARTVAVLHHGKQYPPNGTILNQDELTP